MGFMPWNPLAGGFLSGKYQREDTTRTGRLGGANPLGDSKFTDRNRHILDTLRAVAAEADRPMAQVAPAWTLVGAREASQLEGNIGATGLRLSGEQLNRLGAASAPAASFSASLTTPAIRRMVFGVQDVVGWSD